MPVAPCSSQAGQGQAATLAVTGAAAACAGSLCRAGWAGGSGRLPGRPPLLPGGRAVGPQVRARARHVLLFPRTGEQADLGIAFLRKPSSLLYLFKARAREASLFPGKVSAWQMSLVPGLRLPVLFHNPSGNGDRRPHCAGVG